MKSRFLNKIIKLKQKGRFGRILVLTGARQTGKTTLAKKCFPKFNYLSIEDPILRIEYKKMTSTQWENSFPNAILDEVQKEPILIDSIKSVYDQFKKPHYVLLGSSQLLLMKKVKESLAGRCLIFEVFPLTIPELLSKQWDDEPKLSFFQKYIINKKLPSLPTSFKLLPNYAKVQEVFEYYLKFGGYPAIIGKSTTDKERYEWLKNYINTYLERDIRELSDFKNLEPFIRIQQTSSLLTGQQVNYSQLAKECGVTGNTAQRFLTYLEISYQIFLLKPWYKNKLKRLSKSPKLHFIDPGIQQAILRKKGMLNGNEFESAIISEIYKQLKNSSANFIDMYHLRTLDGNEVDLIIELENSYIAIEVKMSSNINKTDVRHLKTLEQILNKPLIHSFVLSNDTNIKNFGDNIIALPAAMFLS